MSRVLFSILGLALVPAAWGSVDDGITCADSVHVEKIDTTNFSCKQSTSNLHGNGLASCEMDAHVVVADSCMDGFYVHANLECVATLALSGSASYTGPATARQYTRELVDVKGNNTVKFHILWRLAAHAPISAILDDMHCEASSINVNEDHFR